MRLNQGYGHLRPQNSYWNPWKTGARADVRDSKWTGRKACSQEQRLRIMPLDSLFTFNPSKVYGLVPMQHQLIVLL